jgi:hypothetical protein
VSAIVIASSWSCVTWTNVIPTSFWIRLQLELHLLAELEVERAERLVEEQHPRVTDDRARERDALLLPTGELLRLRSLAPARSTSSSTSRTRDRRSVLPILRRSSPNATFSATVMWGNRA